MIDSSPRAFVNGLPQSSLSLSDRGLAYGDGVFETMLVVNRSTPLWSLHRNRLFSGLSCLGIDLYQGQLNHHLQQIDDVLSHSSESYWVHKLMITRGQDGHGYQPASESSANIISQLFPKCKSPLNQIEASVHLCQQSLIPTPGWAGLKTLNQLIYVLSSRERSGTAFDEGLLLSANGDLIEATARNIFIVKKNILLTPKITLCGVSGTMKHLITETLAPTLGIQVMEKNLSLNDLRHADEVFLSNAVTGIWPVINYFEKKQDTRQWNVGVLTRQLQNALVLWMHKPIDDRPLSSL